MASSSSTERLARYSSHHPWRVVGIWVAALVIFGALQGVVKLDSTTDVTLLNDPESQRGWDLLEEHGIRDQRSGTETVVIQSESTTVDDPAFQQTVQQVTDALRADTDVVGSATNFYELNGQNPDAANGLVSADRRTTIIPVTLVGDLEEAANNGGEFLDLIKDQRDTAPGFKILTVGDASLSEEINTITEEDIATGESFGAGIAFIILLFVFAALVAAFLPLILAIISIGIAFGLAAILSQVFELSFFVTNIITMIGLAVGVDYSLFVVERYREERRRGAEKLHAIQIAGATSSRAVLFSGLTVIFALAGMLIVPNNIYRSLGIGAILVVIVAVIGSLTLIPAVISLLGDKLDWPRRRKYDTAGVHQKQFAYDHETIHRGFWGRITSVVMANPVISLVVAVVFLAVCALPYLDFEPGLGGVSTFPDDLEAKQAFVILQSEFSAGLVSPVEIVVEGPINDPSVQQGIETLKTRLAETQLNGQPLYGPATVTPSEDGQLALITVPLKVAPDEKAATDAMKQLRDDIVPPIEGSMTDSEILVTGITANNLDFLEMRETYTPIVFFFVLGLSFLLLLVVFRSIVIAIKAIIMNLLSVGAAYGLIVWVFQEGHLADFFGFQTVEVIEAWLPLFLFSILFGLSMDYHVFLLSRIKEHYDLSGRNRESVAVGLQATGKIITGAALIMVAVFAGFAAGRLTFLQQVGFGLGVAVLLDATIVRSVLVPSAMALLNTWNWYLPSWLNWLPNVHVEGTVDHTPPPAGAPAAD